MTTLGKGMDTGTGVGDLEVHTVRTGRMGMVTDTAVEEGRNASKNFLSRKSWMLI